MKVLLLSSGTGEGHNSAAYAVMDALMAKNVECVFVDPLSFQSENAKTKAAGIYNNIISHIPFLFGMIYTAGAIYDKTHFVSPIYKANSKYADKLAEYINKEKFDAVVCPHLFAMQSMAYARTALSLDVPVYCIMTDHTLHPFHKEAKSLNLHFAPDERVKSQMIKRGFEENKVVLSGIPANPKFSFSISKSEAKEILQIPNDKKIISIMTGGAGCGKVLKLCKKFSKKLSNEYLICVFPGKNEKLRQKLKLKFKADPKFKILPFTNDINIYLKASDIALSKPGGLSSTEIATANVPFVLLKAIPGCETYNVKYYKKNGLALYGKSMHKAVKHTLKLLEDSNLRENMLKAQKKFIPEHAADFIANKIIEEIK